MNRFYFENICPLNLNSLKYKRLKRGDNGSGLAWFLIFITY